MLFSFTALKKDETSSYKEVTAVRREDVLLITGRGRKKGSYVLVREHRLGAARQPPTLYDSEQAPTDLIEQYNDLATEGGENP